MRIGRVRQALWPSARHQGLEDRKLLEVTLLHTRPQTSWEIRPGNEAQGLFESDARVIAIDELGAGPGDLVLVGVGSRLRDLTIGTTPPTKTVVLAIIDGAAEMAGALSGQESLS